jgi:putative membrane protein
MIANTANIRKWLQALLLLGLGFYFLDNMLTGRVYFYINERFGWLSWLATVIFLVLGIINIYDLLRERRNAQIQIHDAHDHEAHDHHDHAHDHGHQHGLAPSWGILGLVALPLVLGLAIPAKPLGAAAIDSSGISTSFSAVQGSGSTTTQFALASTDRNVLDWVRAFNSTENLNEFNGQEADLVGFVYRDVRFKDPTQFMIARFTISCCVADASAIGVYAQYPDAAKLTQDGWVHIKGHFTIQQFEGQATPILVADLVEPTNQPQHPYLYP